jgi:choline kinase
VTTTQAVILAAGIGSRLRPLTDDRPKAALPLGGRPLVAHALAALEAAGVTSVVVVAGHAREALVTALGAAHGLDVTVVDNPAYATTNTLASLLCAAPALRPRDFLLVDGDLVFEAGVLAALEGPGTRLAIDAGRPLDDDAVKVALAGRRVAAVGKVLPADRRPAAESIGIARIDAATAPRLFAAGHALLAAGQAQAYYEAAFQRLLSDGAHVHVADVTGLRWVEIDDAADLRRAEALFAPVASTRGPG